MRSNFPLLPKPKRPVALARKRLISSLTALSCFLAASLTISTANQASAAGCDPGGGGSGTADEPFLISNQAQLEAINSAACLATGLHFKQSQDIALTGTWSPIGDPVIADHFEGSYDGNNMSISGLVVNASAPPPGIPPTGNRGLFGSVRGGAIRNLRLEAPSVDSSTDTLVGAVAGHLWGGLIDNVRIIGGSVKGVGTVGGLVGQTESLGGTRATVRDSSSSASVEETGNSTAGGLIGFAQGTDVIRSYATGSVVGTEARVGGLIGEMDPIVRPTTCIGSSILNSYALGSATGGPPFGLGIGGLVGLVRSESACVPTLTNVYATGSVRGTAGFAGGLAGEISGGTTPSVSGSYWNTLTSGMSVAWPAPPAVSGVLGKTTIQMRSIDTYTDWSIASSWSPTTTWVICSSFNDGYPHLASFYDAADAPCIDPPGAPAAPTADAGDGSATITATAGGGGTAASVLVSATSGSHSCTITGTSGTCTITGLTNGTSYTFTATGRNSAGDSPASTASAPVTPSDPPVPPEPAPEPPAPPEPAPAPSASEASQADQSPIDEAPERQDSAIPTSLPQGFTSMLINGQPIPVQEQQLRRGQGLSIAAGPVSMSLRSATTSGRAVPLAPDGSLLLARSGELPITASGLAAGSEVTLTLFSDPITLGTTAADPNGDFASTLGIPSTTPLGSHTLRLQGTANTGEAFTLDVGVSVATPAVALGADPILMVKDKRVKGTRVLDVRVRGVQARCLVTFTAGKEKIKVRAKKTGTARAHFRFTNTSVRTVKVTARVTGKGCARVQVTKQI